MSVSAGLQCTIPPLPPPYAHTHPSTPPAGEVRYIYPFQVAITDGGAQKKRIAALKERLGWSLVGCELVECFVL